MMMFAPSSQKIANSWFSGIVWIDVVSSTVSSQMTFQSDSSLANLEIKITVMTIDVTWCDTRRRLWCTAMCLFKLDKDLLTLFFQSGISLANLEVEMTNRAMTVIWLIEISSDLSYKQNNGNSNRQDRRALTRCCLGRDFFQNEKMRLCA